MADAIAMNITEPTSDERTMAILAHVLQVVAWWIAPLIIFLVKPESRFVRFHALQALLLQIVYALLLMACGLVWFATFFWTIASGAPAHNAPPPPAFFLIFFLIWSGFMAAWVAVLVVAILYGVKAGRGEWAEYPVLGRLARRFLKLGPGGVSLQV